MKNSSTLIAGFSIIVLTLLSVTPGYANPRGVGTLRYSVLAEQPESVLSIAFNPIHEDILAVGRADGTIRLWNTSTSELLHTLGGRTGAVEGHTDVVFTLAFSPDGNKLASGSADGTVWVWNTTDIENQKSIEELWKFSEHNGLVLTLAFLTENGNALASGSKNGSIRFWNIETGEWQDVISGDVLPAVLSLASSPKNNLLATGRSDKIIRVWNLTAGELMHTFDGHKDDVTSLAFNSDGNTLVSGSADGTVRLWSISPDASPQEFTPHTDWVNSVALHETTLASGSHDKTIRLWNANTGKLQHTLTAHTGSVESVAFNADGDTLASGSVDGRVLLWKLAPVPDAPDLVVESVTANKITLDPGETFTLTAILKNRGIGRAEAPIYYRWHRSTHPNIHKMGGSDKVLTGASEEIGKKRKAVAVKGNIFPNIFEDVELTADQFSKQYMVLTAPEKSGTYYYSVCVESPLNESDNCSADVEITVQSPVNIPDLNLRAVIEKELSKNPGATITATDMQTITGLNAKGKSIEKLTGLEFAINLEKLDLSNNQISDVSPLAGLTKLEELDLSDNSNAKGKSITNLTGLELAINLEKLDLSNNQISDLTPLKDLKNLEELDLSDNKILDVNPLANLTELKELDLDNNSISDMSALAGLKNLTLHFNKHHETINEYGSTVYNYGDSDSNKVVLIKGMKLEKLSQEGRNKGAQLVNGKPDFSASNLDYTHYQPLENDPYFKIYGQPNNHTCGHTSALMLSHYYGVKFSTKMEGIDLFNKLAKGSFSLECNKILLSVYPNLLSLPTLTDLRSFRLDDALKFSCIPGASDVHYQFGPGTLPHEMAIGLKKIFPFPTEVRNGTGNVDSQKKFLENQVSKSCPPIVLLKLKRLSLHWVVVVGYDTKADKFLIADPSPQNKGKFKWWEWTNQPGCGPSLQQAWSLEDYLFDLDCVGTLAWTAEVKALAKWLGGAVAATELLNAGTQYFAVFPTEAPPPHHLESQTIQIHKEGKSKFLGFWTDSTWTWDRDFQGKKVIDCRWSFIKLESCSEPDVRWSDEKVTVSGTCEDGKIDKGIVDMFLTVYYESGGAAHSAPSIVFSVPSTNTSLLPNYPNPFNPETWIPYQLSEPADVTLTIYDIQGRVVRNLDLGHQRAGMYHSRSRAAHWDGRNAQGESVASGIYFYTLTAGEFTATRKLLIRK
ncbi:MAG: leucine-rich repeat domain-containing protein [Candidatus Poribacteria bacterium]|nr:leucine-rich repeat domain-containing protein [Candidatus Poribacteria bacterium]